MKLSDRISKLCRQTEASIKSIVKVALQSRRPTVTKSADAIAGKPLIILGNGPSLRDLIDTQLPALAAATTMAVNFAANTDEFLMLRPDFYLMADPHFFVGMESDPNVRKMFNRFNELVDWPMTLYLPQGQNAAKLGITNRNITVENFNFVGAEGFEWLERAFYGSGRAMPRPRNVLVPALMTAINAGFKEIYLTGADHGWTQTLGVNDNNEVVSYQPHFYKDNADENARVASVYRNVKLHEILLSFHLAFKSYHMVRRYAESVGVSIYNATPGSFIDAFERKGLPFG